MCCLFISHYSLLVPFLLDSTETLTKFKPKDFQYTKRAMTTHEAVFKMIYFGLF